MQLGDFQQKNWQKNVPVFFECEDEANIYCAETLDDERLLKEMKRFEGKE